MRYVDEKKIEGLLAGPRRLGSGVLDGILAKSLRLKRLSLAEAATLLSVTQPRAVRKIFRAAAAVKDAIYGKRVVLFAPLYISNRCVNACAYCAFKSSNTKLVRRALTPAQIRQEVSWLLARGHKRILLVAGESALRGEREADYYARAIRAVYAAHVGPHLIRRVNINCAPLGVAGFRRLKKAGIGTYQLFQETYHEATYRRVHPAGPKADPDARLAGVDRAFRAGIDDVGVGVLYGLYDHRFETLGLLSHVEALERRFGVGPHTISVPRLEPALGVDLARDFPHQVPDEDFKKVVAILRLAVPYTGLILSTRESASLRDELFTLGISQVSAESRTSPGGYACGKDDERESQFALSDRRSLDQVIGALIKKDLMPSFCAACYRKERTGEKFMAWAKPGTIKGKCQMNALITLKEYLDDFASAPVRRAGYRLIEKEKNGLADPARRSLESFFTGIGEGRRDEYV